MHDYILADIVEVFEYEKTDNIFLLGEHKFVGHNYVLFCPSCGTNRVVKEVTFNKMTKLGLIKEVAV